MITKTSPEKKISNYLDRIAFVKLLDDWSLLALAVVNFDNY